MSNEDEDEDVNYIFNALKNGYVISNNKQKSLSDLFSELNKYIDTYEIKLTHISKFTNSSSKGDNISFNEKNYNNGYITTNNINFTNFDAQVSRSTYSTLTKFLTSEYNSKYVIDLLLTRDYDFIKLLTQTPSKINEEDIILLCDNLEKKLTEKVLTKTDYRNKQVYFKTDTGYDILTILTPSVMVKSFKDKISKIIENNIQIKEDKTKIINECQINKLPKMVSFHYVGSNGLNVSTICGKISKINKLLVSLPPKFNKKEFYLGSNYFDYVKNKFEIIECIKEFNNNVILNDLNNIHVKNKRDRQLRKIAGLLFETSIYIQEFYNSGWSKNEKIPKYQKQWLDSFYIRDNNDWIDKVSNDAVRWFITEFNKINNSVELSGTSEYKHIDSIFKEFIK